MPDHRQEAFPILDRGQQRAFPTAPRGGYLPLDLDDDCPWRMSQSTRRKSATVKIGTWVLLGLLAFLVARVLMSR
ncbi:MAG TPA: hypothetical protein VJN96_03065 [Vicinamibacterales bacterium]|nr:hypothetical protein [Vicinamibacterales bacterium]